MKITMKRVICLAAVLVLMFSLAVPAFAASSKKITTRTGTYYVQLPAVDGIAATPQFSIAWSNSNFTIKRADVKLKAGNTDAKIVGFYKNANSWNNENLSESSGSWKTSKDGNYNYTICIKVSKHGPVTLTYKIGESTYKLKIVFVSYSNCISSIKMTGVNNGKNFASLTKKSCSPSKNLTLPAKTSGTKVTLKAADGWKVRYVELCDQTTGISRNVCASKGAASITLSCGTLNPKHNYYLRYQCMSTSNEWFVGANFYIHGANAS